MSEKTFLEVILEKAIEVGDITIDGKSYRYAIIPASFEPGLPNFVGLKEGLLFISEETPIKFRPYIFTHEVRCLSHVGEPGHCWRALQEELELVPNDLRTEYIFFRLRFFRNLVQYLQTHEPGSPLLPEVKKSLEYLEPPV